MLTGDRSASSAAPLILARLVDDQLASCEEDPIWRSGECEQWAFQATAISQSNVPVNVQTLSQEIE